MSTKTQFDGLAETLEEKDESFHHDLNVTDSAEELIDTLSILDSQNVGVLYMNEGSTKSGKWNIYRNSLVNSVADKYGQGFASRLEQKVNEANYDAALEELRMVSEAYDDGINEFDKEIGLDENSNLSDEKFYRVMKMKKEGEL